MAGNTSATGGYLLPQLSPAPTPIVDDELENLLQAVIKDLTDLPGALVRPRWQPSPPAKPSAETNWVSVGIISQRREGGLAESHVVDGEGNNETLSFFLLSIMASFYGPRRYSLAEQVSDGLQVSQNRGALQALGLGFVDADDIVTLPEDAGGQWIRRADLSFRLRRRVDRSYPVLSLREASVNFRYGDADGQAQSSLLTVTEE